MQGEEFKNFAGDLLGDGIFAADGAKWHKQRKVASNLFKRVELEGYMTEVFVEHGQTFNSILDKHAGSGEEFDLGVRSCNNILHFLDN